MRTCLTFGNDCSGGKVTATSVARDANHGMHLTLEGDPNSAIQTAPARPRSFKNKLASSKLTVICGCGGSETAPKFTPADPNFLGSETFPLLGSEIALS